MVLKFIFLNEFSPVQSGHLGCPRFHSLIFTRVSDPIIVGVFHEFSQKISKVEIQTDIISRWSRARSKSIRGKDERVPERESECLNGQILNHILIINKICKISCRSSWFGFGFCKKTVRFRLTAVHWAPVGTFRSNNTVFWAVVAPRKFEKSRHSI